MARRPDAADTRTTRDARTAAEPPAVRVPTGTATRTLLVLLVATVLAYAVTGPPRAEAEFDPWIDGVLRLSAFAVAAVLAVARPVRSPSDRVLWGWVAVAVTARGLGSATFAVWVRPLDPPPYPSVADAWWLLSYLALLVAVATLAVRRRGATSTALVLDGLVAALAVAAVTLAIVRGTFEGLLAAGAGTGAAAVNLAYPLLDIVLLVVTAGVLTAGRGPRSPAVWVLATGVLGLAAADVTHVHLVVTDGLGPGTWLSLLSALSLASTAALAVAAWLPDRPPDRRAEAPLPHLVAPAVASLVCLALLVIATAAPLPTVVVALATAGLLTAIARTVVSFRLIRSAVEHRRAARTDDLTGVANRRACNEVLERALDRRATDEEVTLVVLDLDGFREINDTYGHHVGDELLQRIARRLEGAVREGDLLARIGGDEFAVVMDGVGVDVALEVAERLTASVRRPLALGPRELSVDVSVGIAVCPTDATEASELLRRADLAMYDAKSSGTGPRTYDPVRHVPGDARRRTVEELRDGIARHELVVHYQPQVHLGDGAVVGVEALVRWQHPREGLLPPASFLPVAESGGLMRQLVVVVLRDAVHQTAAWRDAGLDVTTAVNLSVSNLLDAAFPSQLDDLLRSTRLPAEALTLELTEDLFVVDPGRAQRQITTLLDRGVRLWVDDYGTGYSSLGYLRDLEGLAGIKLDRSFVGHIDRDVRARAIVASTISLATALELDVVAEGVETPAVRDILADLGCRTAQGYLFSRPLPAADLALTPIDAGRAGAP